MNKKLLIGLVVVIVVALGLGFFLGKVSLRPAPGEALILSGPPWAQEAALGINKTLTGFPDLKWEHIEHRGIFNPFAGWIVEWVSPKVPLEDTTLDLLLALVVPTLPPLEREDKEVCIWNDTVCFFPPKNIPVCLWAAEFPQNSYCFHPGMDEDNPEHPGLAHPPLLITSTNLKGPLEFPADFEEKYQGRVWTRTAEELKKIWK